jgi:PadR family transcriptional regulator PadR
MATNDTSPLSPATFHVLLSLASKDLHGYGIILEINRISNGEYRPGPGTLYDNLAKLLNLGWVEDYEEKARAGEEGKRLYRLTPEGRNVLAADVQRMKRVVRIAHRLLGEEGGRA